MVTGLVNLENKLSTFTRNRPRGPVAPRNLFVADQYYFHGLRVRPAGIIVACPLKISFQIKREGIWDLVIVVVEVAFAWIGCAYPCASVS